MMTIRCSLFIDSIIILLNICGSFIFGETSIKELYFSKIFRIWALAWHVRQLWILCHVIILHYFLLLLLSMLMLCMLCPSLCLCCLLHVFILTLYFNFLNLIFCLLLLYHLFLNIHQLSKHLLHLHSQFSLVKRCHCWIIWSFWFINVPVYKFLEKVQISCIYQSWSSKI